MTAQIQQIFTFENVEQQTKLLGVNDNFLQLIEEGLTVRLHARGDQMTISGDEDKVPLAKAVLRELTTLIKHQINISDTDVVSAITMAQRGTLEYFGDLYSEVLIRDNKGRSVHVKNFGQRQYVQSIRKNDVTFGIGPAGTGKTFLAVVMAIAALKRGDVERIIITRPAVEAGESLGFLPGDLKEKVDPYMRPIYDAMNALIGAEQTQRLMERGVIEIAPLAYMRGRTLDEAFIILDEAQNTTNQQMKMFLTRFGFGSKMIINGDISQIDLPYGAKSGLISVQRILKDVSHVSFIHFGSADVVRHPVVGLIVGAYEAAEKKLAELKKEQIN
ncbi:PhoH family protein [Leuconostoc suionicum]|uniref:PhoH family protein n=1 Tax=Leuconostoc suionicum TaxID=1511761 RepID=UPI0021A9A15D|nr:PhoH family protein [Leuconostoc suionicum]MCT4381839.1 PhoH family protein [Leuconostoc suionicum]MDC2805413.1 PhoH family protein [Leuconostoc suionicum]MDC2815641.1 PhoH family protein [Leuconostoc suionicum]MDC2822925.1 PhoH family protein [Leuconostoc suionicum]